MKARKLLVPMLTVVTLILAALACGSSNSGTKVGESNTGSSASPTVPPTQVFKIGDIVQASDHTVVLNGVEVNGNVLKANFLIENKGSKDLAVSTLISFSAKNGDGSKLEQEIFDCGPQLDGKVLPGDKVKGDVCYKDATVFPVRIYYEANLLGSGATVWEIAQSDVNGSISPTSPTEETNGNGSESPTTPPIQVYKVGDVIQINDQTIVLNNAEINGDVLKANFTIENKGAKELLVSSMVSFSAKNGDGAKLELDIFGCGAQLDGTVLPGDKIKGDVCYKGVTVFPVKIYYDPSMLGSGAGVWEVYK